MSVKRNRRNQGRDRRSGGRCGYPDERRSDGICGREAAAVYVNERCRPRNVYRCARHDRAVDVEQAAARLGYHRLAVEGDR